MSAKEMRARIRFYRTALSIFSSSSSPFQILHSLPTIPPTIPPPKTLYILDSSFNPPTLAHLRIALSALTSSDSSTPSRLLLLLATQNADKAPKPASFEQRLAMMEIFASEILARLRSPSVGVDIAVTTLPYFVDKARAIVSSGAYGDPKMETETEQVHLIGFDTLTRILDPKYYPPKHTLEGLAPFLERHRLRVAYRTDDKWGSRVEQDRFVGGIGEGSLDVVGGRREWVNHRRIELVEGKKGGEEVISSTKVREAVKEKDWEGLRTLVTDDVGEWIRENGLYDDD